MSSADSSRRLHGVLLADMTGFSRLMGEDEARAFAALTRIRDVFTRVVPRHGGTLDVLVGDCFVALFDSAVEAVRAAIAIQTDLAAAAGPAGDPVRIRIGVHMGDVVRSGAEIHGDSVNVAARLQTIAQPGRITLSDEVYRAVRNRVDVPVRDLGLKSLKNIRDKMRVYEIDVTASPGRPAESAAGPGIRPFALAAVGVLAVAGLAWLGLHVARRGPALESTPVAQPAPAPAPTAPPAVAVQAPLGAPTPEKPLMVGITGVNANANVPAWVKDNTRDGLNTLLSKIPRLRVFSREKIDFLRERKGLSEIEVAETLGIQKMIVGALAMEGQAVVLEARVVDIATGILDASESQKGDIEQLIDLQNRLAGALLAALHVPLSDDEKTQLFAKRTNETLDAYRRMADTFGDATGGAQPTPAPAKKRQQSWLSWPGIAWAADAAAAGDASEDAIRAVIEAYRAALQAKDVAAVAAVHVELPPEQREGFTRYFASADGLTVAISDVDVLVDGDEALATFTRHDVFKDHSSGKEMQLEVRLSTVVVQKDGGWRMRGVKKSS